MRIVDHQTKNHLITLFDSRNIHFICVEIDDIPSYAKELIESIKNTSWIDKLDKIGKLAYTETTLETIKKLISIFSYSEDPISTDFGEYLISMTAGSSLEELLSHDILPLSELWKEKNQEIQDLIFTPLRRKNTFLLGKRSIVLLETHIRRLLNK